MKGIITIIIIIAIIAVGFLLLRDGTSDTADVVDVVTEEVITEESAGDTFDMVVELGDTPDGIDVTVEIIVVTYSDDGFAPKEITVTQGQTVRFVNESSGNMWVASVVHPTHTVLPKFDQKSTGNSYEFQFNDAGSWNYHNHVKPNTGGTIIVK